MCCRTSASIDPAVRTGYPGHLPGPAFEFVGGRKEIDSLYEIRYKSSLSLNLGYTCTGAAATRTFVGRDFRAGFRKYQF